jgi:uncharacterized protein YjbI with pentapeptide repeats
VSTTVVAAVAAGVAIILVIALGYRRRWAWTGFIAVDGRPRTLWDWLGLLVIPLALAALGFALSAAQTERDNRRDDARARLDRTLAGERAAADRARALDQDRDEILRVYLDQMSGLLLDRNLLRAPVDSEARALAHTLTLSVLPRLDGERKGVVVRFLDEARLIRGQTPKVRLWGADLRHVRLDGASLDRPALRRADLRHASFRRMVLYAPSFYSSDLRGADFTDTILDDPDFGIACLSNVSFRGATLNRPDLRSANGHEVDFTGASGGGRFRGRLAEKAGIDRAEEDRACVRGVGSTLVG